MTAFTGRARITFLAGLALNIVGSFSLASAGVSPLAAGPDLELY